MAQSLCSSGLMEPLEASDAGRHEETARAGGSGDQARWGMGLVTAVTLIGFSTLAATTAIAWSLAGF